MNLRFFRQFHRGFDAAETLHLPHVGQRILKTTLAVFLCLLIYALRGFEGQDMPTEAAITAIICMQPYVQDSKTYALNRAVGTLIGAACGLLLLLLLSAFPALGQNRVILYALMAAGVLTALYSTVLVQMPTDFWICLIQVRTKAVQRKIQRPLLIQAVGKMRYTVRIIAMKRGLLIM